jgi:hypothetical protein
VDGRSIPWIVGLTLYFIALFAVTWSVNAALSTDADITDINQSSQAVNSEGYCDTPRTGGTTAFGEGKSTYARCDFLAVQDNATCSSVEGCEWTDTETFLFFWEQSVPAYCSGCMDVSAYGYTDGLLPGVCAGPFFNICTDTNITNDRQGCELIGCTWHNPINDPGSELGPTTMIKNIKWMMGFQADWGFSFTGDFLVRLLFIYVPFIALLISVRYLLPI